MDLTRLEELKEKLVKSKNFQEIYDYFLDHFGENDEFLDVGKRTSSPPLEAFMAAIGRQLLGNNIVISNMLLVEIPGHSFIHGACWMNRRMLGVFYFEDIQVGLAALVGSRPSEMTQFSRFTGRELPPQAVPSKN